MVETLLNSVFMTHITLLIFLKIGDKQDLCMREYVIIIIGEHIFTVVFRLHVQKGLFYSNDERYGISK